ncbi:MAG: twin-arginine translocase subunit TatB [Candidatus Pelagibacter sp.]|nr:twin-arginine translocase subunit TatB [Candidatus Pelagibacter sp.]|tara:strand:- start:30011 stop:30223 length:213 start_codon:yes stop_codon:yes gene_type:complete
MPQIGWSELLVIIILAVLIIGPKDMPKVLRKIAGSIKKIKSYISNIQDDIENSVDLDTENEKNNKNKKNS